MPQLIPGGGRCGQLSPDQVGPVFYLCACPECGDEFIDLGREEDMAYGTSHDDPSLNEVCAPFGCGQCSKRFYLKLETAPLGGLLIRVTQRK